ncbi:hypothetical protein EW146_g5576 [Bondarzewia mesenterica]|uniref:Uncharacterized protein n=1 Tax=Bondarzewia mesenterica TaxID=1095465 RepID=A0A4S4LWS7_9AGAM|nr:hypothetical protein EW146_g5576 [Bondarzewia mesenterica]
MSDKLTEYQSEKSTEYAPPPPYEQYGSPPRAGPQNLAQGASRGLADSYYSPTSGTGSAYGTQSSAYPSQQSSYYPQSSPYPSQSYQYPSQSSPYPANSYSYAANPSPYPSSPYPPVAPSHGPYPNSAYSSGSPMTGGQVTLSPFTYAGKAPPKRNPFTPPPPSFTRGLNPNCLYPHLPAPIRIPSQTKANLSSGFAPIFPSPELLLAHDVLPEDFSRLLEDCHLMGQLVGSDKIKSNVIPVALGVSLIGGLFMAHGIEGRMRENNVSDVNGLVEVWDEVFFAPRRLKVWIEIGSEEKRKGSHGRESSSSPSASSSSDSDSDHGKGHGGSRAEGKRKMREKRRDDRRERKEERREERRARKEARRVSYPFSNLATEVTTSNNAWSSL